MERRKNKERGDHKLLFAKILARIWLLLKFRYHLIQCLYYELPQPLFSLLGVTWEYIWKHQLQKNILYSDYFLQMHFQTLYSTCFVLYTVHFILKLIDYRMLYKGQKG